MLVRGVVDGTSKSNDASGVTSSLPDGVTTFAMKKITSLGFHPSRVVKALKKTKGDVGLAVEYLVIIQETFFTQELKYSNRLSLLI